MVLPADEGALVQKALEAARTALFGARRPDAHDAADCVGWSDAVVHLAEAALSNIERTGRAPADRFQVIFHVDADEPERARCTWGPCCRARFVTTWPAPPPPGWCSSATGPRCTSSPAGAASTTASGR